MFKAKSILVATISASFVVIAAPHASAASVADPSFQIKLQLNDSALNASGKPSRGFADFANLGSQTGSEESVYLDTADKSYSNQGWSIRLRHKDSSSNFDVTYKWRTKLSDNSLSSSSIDAGLETAKDKGFDSSDTNYKAQVNASYNTSTLDFSTKKKTDCAEYQCTIPSASGIVSLASDMEPGKLQKAIGTTMKDQELLVTDVVRQKTWDVEIDGVKTSLEVSTINGQHWIEISEDETSRSKASEKRDKLIAALKDAGYLKTEDAFKTHAALDTLH